MDKSLYIAMTGAKETMNGQAIRANNIANVNTPGFRASLEQQRSMPVFGDGFASRVYAGTEAPGHSFKQGGLNNTDRQLDIAINGNGWFSVLGEDGSEAYTRRGDLTIDENGVLLNGAGNVVLGIGGGPITLPPARSIDISESGAINITPLTGDPGTVIFIDTIKTVNPDLKNLQQRSDGLFQNKDGTVADATTDVKIKSGVLESSNVNIIGELVDSIALARKYELDIKMMKTSEENDQVSARILQYNA